MDVSGLEPNKPVPLLGLEILLKQGVREWNGNRVCSCTARDASGECVLSLWNNDVDVFREGDLVVLKKGWCKEYNGVLQVSSGRFGEIDLIRRPLREIEKTQIPRSPEAQVPMNSYLRPAINEIRRR